MQTIQVQTGATYLHCNGKQKQTSNGKQKQTSNGKQRKTNKQHNEKQKQRKH